MAQYAYNLFKKGLTLTDFITPPHRSSSPRAGGSGLECRPVESQLERLWFYANDTTQLQCDNMQRKHV